METSNTQNPKLQEAFERLVEINTFIGVKILEAAPLALGAYNALRGWDMPKDEVPSASGYIVRYADGYLSWSPVEAFEDAYRLASGMPFGHAIEAAKRGKRIARAGWNGKGMFVYLVKGTDVTVDLLRNEAADAFDAKYDGKLKVPGIQVIGSHFDMMAADGTIVVGWLASQTDMLAEDWSIVD